MINKRDLCIIFLAFHFGRARMENIGNQFPEIAAIDPRIWNNVCQETNNYQQKAAYILFDLRESYRNCWQILMTKRCAQMLLKYELTAAIELNKTGMLTDTEHKHIVELIEQKIFDLEFFRLKLPRDRAKAIESSFDLLPMFRTLSNEQRTTWATIMKPKHQWFQPGSVLLEKDIRATTCYLIVRGIIECKANTNPVYYRSGSIIGIDTLFAPNLSTYGTYSVTDGLVEAFCIDSILLNQLLSNEILSPWIYHEIALHILSNNYHNQVKLNRSQLKLLLQKKSEFFQGQKLSIQLQPSERLFLLSGSVIHSSDGQNLFYNAIEFQVIRNASQIHLEQSTVLYRWRQNDEAYCIRHRPNKVYFPVQIFGSISNDLRYPGYSANIEPSTRRHSIEMLSYTRNIQGVTAGSLDQETTF